MPGDLESSELEFPKSGVDVSCAPSEAPAYTCAVAVNVRLQDVFHSRQRGGSRPGLTPLLPPRPSSHTPTQHLGVVVYYTPQALLTVEEQLAELNTPGGLVLDTMSSNFPDGPGPTGPGGGPNAPTSPPFPAGFNRRTPASPPAPYPRYRPAYGSGVQPHRTVGPTVNPVPPPPPPPPGPLTRTYTPFAEFHAGEIVGVFAIGPVTIPLTPPTDLSVSSGLTNAVDYFGDQWQEGTLPTWGGATLPTVAQINAFYSGFDHGPYESSVDS